ncbi:hypothetical protein V1283_007036 [Bradyrhizobium sp. AZCC 2262]|uniref:hypothetical protein n=1 Tax=Bradyrhizobium sp. AZCC 2262 TaxID=3117022 RepID=UPI002FF3A9EC
MSKTKDDCTSYYPNDALAAVIVRAWSDKGFEGRLLSGANLTNKASTTAALEEMGISLDDVVVLEPKDLGGYKRKEGQILFVLPKVIGKPSMETARIAMASTCDGI